MSRQQVLPHRDPEVAEPLASARDRGLEAFAADDLFEPATNIALGSHYSALNLDEETLKEVEDDLRRAAERETRAR